MRLFLGLCSTAAAALVGPITTPLTGALGGAVLCAVQWLALRRRLLLSPWWIAATGLGMAIDLALSITLLGTSTDGAALPLRGVSSRAPIWGLMVMLGWALGWIITRAVGVDLSSQWSVFGSSGALTFQPLTGLTLAWMLRGNRVASSPTAELAS